MRLREFSDRGTEPALDSTRDFSELLRSVLRETKPTPPLTPEQARARAERRRRAQEALNDAQAECRRRLARARERVAAA
jgi:hypothetical protein